jgi:hypothetical protein
MGRKKKVNSMDKLLAKMREANNFDIDAMPPEPEFIEPEKIEAKPKRRVKGRDVVCSPHPKEKEIVYDVEKMTDEEIAALPPDEKERLKRKEQEELYALLAEFERRRTQEAIRYYRPNRAQAPFHYCRNLKGEIPRNRLLQGSNKVGKTKSGSAEDVAHALGYRPWLEKDDPNYKINISVPNNGLVLGETLTNSVDKKLVPDILSFIPTRCFGPKGVDDCTKRNNQGVIVRIKIPFKPDGVTRCGSVIYFGSYDQTSDIQEGIDWHWIHYDEPPDHDFYIAVERGKVAYDARSWMTMTPLKEAWIQDTLVENADKDDNISVVQGEIWDNFKGFKCDSCGWYGEQELITVDKWAVNVDIPLPNGGSWNWNTVEAKCPSCGGKARDMRGFLNKDAIDDFIKKLDPDEYEARIKGLPKHLQGLVYGKNLRRDLHVIEDFNMANCIKVGWTCYEAVDPHDNRNTCWSFFAVGPDNRKYMYDYLLAGGSVADIVRQVNIKRAMYGYKEPHWVVLDKKHGQKHNAALADGKSWQEELEKCGVRRIILSESSAGDVELGHKMVKEELQLRFSSLHGKEIPQFMMFKKACGGDGGPIYQMFRYSYGDMGDKHDKNPNPKPKDLHKDFPDTIRYFIMAKPVYIDPERTKANKKAMQKRQEDFVNVRRNMYGYNDRRVSA